MRVLFFFQIASESEQSEGGDFRENEAYIFFSFLDLMASRGLGELGCWLLGIGGCVVCSLAVPGVVLLALGGSDLSASKNSVAGTVLLSVFALLLSLVVSGTVGNLFGERAAVLCLAVLIFLVPGGSMLGCAGVAVPFSPTALAGVVLLGIGCLIFVCYGACACQQYRRRYHDQPLLLSESFDPYAANRRGSLLQWNDPAGDPHHVQVDVADPNNLDVAVDGQPFPALHSDDHVNMLANAAAARARGAI